MHGIYPMIGFFNMLIYVRPKVAKLRLQYPHISWIKAFFLIIKAAGREVPAINDTSSSNNSTNAFSRIFCCRGCCVSKHYDDISDLRPRHSEARPSDPRYSEALPSEPDGGASSRNVLSFSQRLSAHFGNISAIFKSPSESEPSRPKLQNALIKREKKRQIRLDEFMKKGTNDCNSDDLPNISST